MGRLRLNAEIARVIFARAHAGESVEDLANDYGVSKEKVHQIKTRRRWANATEGLPSTLPVLSEGQLRERRARASYSAMINRCSDRASGRNKTYYYDRGIRVCARWAESFDNFYEDMGAPPRGTLIDRIDNDGWYGPDNCRWATRCKSDRNRSNSRWLTMDGKRQVSADWAAEYGMNPGTLKHRLQKGMSLREALNAQGGVTGHQIAMGDRSQNLSQWASEYGIHRSTLRARIRKGMDLREALAAPVRRRRSKLTACFGVQTRH